MKTRFWASIVVFVSAYSPLALILAIKDFDSKTMWFESPITIICILSIGLFSVAVLHIIVKESTYGQDITVLRVTNKSNALINYSIPYMISFFGFNFDNWGEIASFIIFMSLLCFLSIKTQSIFINPILAAKNYGLYDVQFDDNGQQKEAIFLSNMKLKIGERYLVDRLSDFTFIVTKEI